MKFYRFTGIGEASAAMVMAAASANPIYLPLTTGLVGKFNFFILKLFFMLMASLGLIVLNVTAAKLETILDAHNFDGSWDTAEKLISDIRNTGKEITPEQAKTIDDPVIDAFRKFASFGRKKKK